VPPKPENASGRGVRDSGLPDLSVIVENLSGVIHNQLSFPPSIGRATTTGGGVAFGDLKKCRDP
jgi:hypothetical protein